VVRPSDLEARFRIVSLSPFYKQTREDICKCILAENWFSSESILLQESRQLILIVWCNEQSGATRKHISGQFQGQGFKLG
jgi:hypothetical protein